MGKSPGKWMRKILHRKKPSKSDSSKNAVDEKSLSPPHVSSRELSSNPANSDLASSNTLTGGNQEVEQEKNVNLCCDDSASCAINSRLFDLFDKAESHKLEVSATILQAALRAFMARQAYRSIRGIVRLQALIRGYLVRRQAAASLHCVKGIVKLQAVVRGRMVRLSDVGVEVNKKLLGETVQDAHVTYSLVPNSSTVLEKMPPNVFACKILASPISSSHLHFQYDSMEANSLPIWLERWSASHFWGSVAQKKKVSGSSAGRKRNIAQTVGSEHGPPKPDVRRVSSAANVDNTFQNMSSEHGKPKRYTRKSMPSQPGEATKDLSENELERVKKSLRKISINSKESSQGKSTGTSIGTVKQRNLSPAQPPQVLDEPKGEPETGILHSSNGSKEHAALIKSASDPDEKKPSGEKNQKPGNKEISVAETLMIIHEPLSDLSHNSLSTEQYSEENGTIGEGITPANEITGKEKRISRRKSMPLSKQEQQLEKKNASQSKQTNLPSYMATTESAKRKLRGLGTPRFGSLEGEEEDSSTRQYSLSTSANGKLSSVSPRILKLSHASSEKDGLMRSGVSLTSSRDSHGKVTRPGWRR